MIRTVLAVVLIIGAIIWLPFSVQVVLFVIATIVVPYRLALFVPAAFADALYAPGAVSVFSFKYTLLVATLLVVHWLIATKTRVGELYAMETK